MGRNARLRKLRREAQRQFQAAPGMAAFAKAYEKEHPDSILTCGRAQEKMSEVIEDFAAPLLDIAHSPEEVKKALMIASFAWNYSLLKENGSADVDRDEPALLADPAIRKILDTLVIRKRELYPDNRRAILDFQIMPNGSEYQFNVVSTMW